MEMPTCNKIVFELQYFTLGQLYLSKYFLDRFLHNGTRFSSHNKLIARKNMDVRGKIVFSLYLYLMNVHMV